MDWASDAAALVLLAGFSFGYVSGILSVMLFLFITFGRKGAGHVSHVKVGRKFVVFTHFQGGAEIDTIEVPEDQTDPRMGDMVEFDLSEGDVKKVADQWKVVDGSTYHYVEVTVDAMPK